MFIGVTNVDVEGVNVTESGYLYAAAAVEIYPGGKGVRS
jgi:hypothetical protein